MPAWDAVAVLADSASLTANTPKTATVAKYRSPVVCVELENLEDNADDTVTIEFKGDAGTYTADERTLSSTGGYYVTVPQCKSISVTSANGATYSVEVRANPD